MEASPRVRVLEKLVKENTEIAHSHGFYITRHRKGWMRILEALMLVVTELAEAAEAYRIHGENWEKEFEEEIADTFIRLFHLCGDLGIDIERAIKEKMEKNKRRKYKHGKIT